MVYETEEEYKQGQKFIKLFTRNRFEAMRLLETTQTKRAMVNSTKGDYRSASHFAAQDGDHLSLLKLIEYGADIWRKCEGDFYPLHLAIMDQRVKCVNILLSAGDIPNSVIQDVAMTITERNIEKLKPCIFHKAFYDYNRKILRAFVLKFLPLLPQNAVKMVVDSLVDVLDLKRIRFIFEESDVGMTYLSHLDSLVNAIQSEEPDEDLIAFLLEIGKYGYPLDMTKHYKLLRSYIYWCPENYVLKLFLRNKHKVINVHTSKLIVYALRSANLDAIDILFAIGSNRKLIPDDEEFKPDVIKKLVLRGGCKLNSSNTTIIIANGFLKQITLFDLLSYRFYLAKLNRELQNGDRKRQRE